MKCHTISSLTFYPESHREPLSALNREMSGVHFRTRTLDVVWKVWRRVRLEIRRVGGCNSNPSEMQEGTEPGNGFGDGESEQSILMRLNPKDLIGHGS